MWTVGQEDVMWCSAEEKQACQILTAAGVDNKCVSTEKEGNLCVIPNFTSAPNYTPDTVINARPKKLWKTSWSDSEQVRCWVVTFSSRLKVLSSPLRVYMKQGEADLLGRCVEGK